MGRSRAVRRAGGVGLDRHIAVNAEVRQDAVEPTRQPSIRTAKPVHDCWEGEHSDHKGIRQHLRRHARRVCPDTTTLRLAEA